MPFCCWRWQASSSCWFVWFVASVAVQRPDPSRIPWRRSPTCRTFRSPGTPSRSPSGCRWSRTTRSSPTCCVTTHSRPCGAPAGHCLWKAWDRLEVFVLHRDRTKKVGERGLRRAGQASPELSCPRDCRTLGGNPGSAGQRLHRGRGLGHSGSDRGGRGARSFGGVSDCPGQGEGCSPPPGRRSGGDDRRGVGEGGSWRCGDTQ